jgi:hypothetical protein
MNTEFLLRQIEELKPGTEKIDSEGVGGLVEQILGILAFLKAEAQDAIEELEFTVRSERSSDLWPLSVSKYLSDDHYFKIAVLKYLRLYRDNDKMLYHIALKVFFRELLQGVPMEEVVERTIELVGSEMRPESVKKLEKRLSRLVTEAG